jgi:hypothetical protein
MAHERREGENHAVANPLAEMFQRQKEENARLTSELEAVKGERDRRGRHLAILGEAIVATARRAGILRDDVAELSGPQILMLADNIRDFLDEKQQRRKDMAKALKSMMELVALFLGSVCAETCEHDNCAEIRNAKATMEASADDM